MSAPADSRPGTYALWLPVAEPTVLAVGRRHRLSMEPGWLIYVGSALGPGGLQARLAHHRRISERPHWHIDYLRRAAALDTVWWSRDPIRRECLWAAVLGDLGGAPPPFRFGASDCHCRAHLRHFRFRPTLARFIAALRARSPDHAAVTAQPG